MRIMRRLNRLDDRVVRRLGGSAGPREGQSRRDYLEEMSRRSIIGYENPYVYRELVELHDRVTALEQHLASGNP